VVPFRVFWRVAERAFRIERVEWGRPAEEPPTPSRRVAGGGGVIAGSWWRPRTGSDHANRKNAEPVAIEPRAKPALVSGPSARALTNRPVTTTATSSRAMATMLGVLMVITPGYGCGRRRQARRPAEHARIGY